MRAHRSDLQSPRDGEGPQLTDARRNASATGAEWMLGAIMDRRHLDPRALAARMREAGYMISDSQVYRYVKEGPRRFLDLIAALCCALDCGVVDLIMFAPEKRVDCALDPPFRLPGT